MNLSSQNFIMFVIASKIYCLVPGLHKQSDLLIMIIDFY